MIAKRLNLNVKRFVLVGLGLILSSAAFAEFKQLTDDEMSQVTGQFGLPMIVQGLNAAEVEHATRLQREQDRLKQSDMYRQSVEHAVSNQLANQLAINSTAQLSTSNITVSLTALTLAAPAMSLAGLSLFGVPVPYSEAP